MVPDLWKASRVGSLIWTRFWSSRGKSIRRGTEVRCGHNSCPLESIGLMSDRCMSHSCLELATSEP